MLGCLLMPAGLLGATFLGFAALVLAGGHSTTQRDEAHWWAVAALGALGAAFAGLVLVVNTRDAWRNAFSGPVTHPHAKDD